MKRIYLCKFAKLVLTVYRRAISAIRNIKFLCFFWVTRCFKNGLLWKICVLLKAFWMVKHVAFPDFSGNPVFWNLLKGPIQYSLVLSQYWRHRNNVRNMSKLTIKKLGWRYWPRSVVFIVVRFEHILHTSGISIVGFEEVNIHSFKVSNGVTKIIYEICQS